MRNTITKTVPTPSRIPLAPLNIADKFSLSCTKINPFQSTTSLYATANPCQPSLQPHTAPKRSPSAFLLSSFSTVNPKKTSAVTTQNSTVPFVTMNNSVETFDGLGHQNTAEEF